jgi:ankyrin repeat protein
MWSFLSILLFLCLVRTWAQDVELDVQMGTEETANFFPLLRAASVGDLATVHDLLQQKHDVNQQLENGVTAVHAAARYNHNDVLHMVSIYWSFAMPTILLLNAINSTSFARKQLIESGANLNVREKDGWTPLMFSAYNVSSLLTLTNMCSTDQKIPNRHFTGKY